MQALVRAVLGDPQRVLVAGDWHGNTGWACSVIQRLPELLPRESPRIVLHCGDFGVWPGAEGARYLREVDRALAEHDAVLWFVDGNHEDHPRLERAPRVEGRGRVAERIWHLPRGHRWRWHGRTWLALGGAVSVDRVLRREGLDWWPGERITERQALRVAADGPADVMLTHDCPALVDHEFGTPPSFWAREDLAAGEAHRRLLQRVVDAVRPSHLIHGHLHRAYLRTVNMPHGPVRVAGLDCDGLPVGNWAVLDVPTMAWLKIPLGPKGPHEE
ncbi:metallophosphoesterase family protein [Actinomadura kijaniata]|uniref:metallophosphoesterase family protein n=1 Tax=Actinomadura kijaniata TaxID=46161 RepID=UPI003F1B32F3